MKKEDAVLSTMPIFYCRYNTVEIYFGQDGICQFERSQKPGQMQLRMEIV